MQLTAKHWDIINDPDKLMIYLFCGELTEDRLIHILEYFEYEYWDLVRQGDTIVRVIPYTKEEVTKRQQKKQATNYFYDFNTRLGV